jgi:antitoxin component YwqK of YwqJK toxin-antitoxin module
MNKGRCNEYYTNGNLRFEGDYLNGLKNGHAKEYYINGNLKFEGEYSN